MAATHLKKVGTGPCLPLWSTPTSGNRGEQLLDLWKRNVAPFLSDMVF